MDRVVVIGGGGHAKVLICVLKKSGYDIAGYTDRQDKGLILGAPYLGDDSILAEMIRKDAACRAIIGIGKIDASDRRIRLQNELLALGYEFPPVVSPHAVVNEEVRLGAGTAVLDGVVVNSGSQIGRACILNTNSTVEHDCRIGDNVHIAPGVTLSGGVGVGDNCLIGTGANVIQGVGICPNCLIGAGSTVVKDITIPGTYVGNPAKRIR
ncbi:acetyltransferase [Oryzomonas rubra]|uniref:Acetyltransferase n=1 Tax=Oryzomonas rubra TaxID=2509454 RepID=A0A5A9XDQ8_9BACT|nr:acetyltransferase [Oryzomonas rubra]KAA0890488.1 acetyltransferase [Oryzomonas rubra]